MQAIGPNVDTLSVLQTVLGLSTATQSRNERHVCICTYMFVYAKRNKHSKWALQVHERNKYRIHHRQTEQKKRSWVNEPNLTQSWASFLVSDDSLTKDKMPFKQPALNQIKEKTKGILGAK